MTSVPYSFIKDGQLFIIPVGPSIDEVPYPSQPLTRPRDFSLWVRGTLDQPPYQLDAARMPPSLYQAVRDDLVRYSPVPVSRSAFTRSQHAYVGVIDSEGTPYRFALDSNGISVRAVDPNDDRVWKTFDALADRERAQAIRVRRADAAAEMVDVDRELSTPLVVIAKSDHAADNATRYALEMARASRDIASDIGDDEAVAREEAEIALLVVVAKSVADPVLLARVSREGRKLHVHSDGAKRAVDSPREAEAALQERLPHGFRVGPNVNVHQASVHAGAPRGEPDPNAIHVMRPSEVASHGVHGNVVNESSLRSIHQAWGEGKRLEPIEMRVHPTGEWHVEDGNHRLQVAARTDAPVAIRFRHAGQEPQAGARDISQRIRAAAGVQKALPRKPREEKVKKTPSRKATKKKAGAGGKPRYTYPQERKGGAAGGGQPQLVVVRHQDHKHADPGELATQLGVSVRTLARCARRLSREEFGKFMRSHLKRFIAKHRIDPAYWSVLHDRLADHDHLAGPS